MNLVYLIEFNLFYFLFNTSILTHLKIEICHIDELILQFI